MDPRRSSRRRSRGFSLIELLVSMAIALVVTLAITVVLVRAESSKRSTSSVNDVNQTAAYVTYVLDRHLRSAGSGFAQRWSDAFGCALNASKSGAAILPRPAAIASPFVNAPLNPRLAPVLIQANGADGGGEIRGDLLTVMAGTAPTSGSPLLVQTSSVQGNAGAGSLQLANTLGFQNGDVVVLADGTVPQGCMAEQVGGLPPGGGGGSPLLPLSGTYYAATGAGLAIGSFGGNTYAIPIGSTVGNPPQFTIYGVGDSRTLFGYDLFQFNVPDQPFPVADGVVEMRAVYGLDTSNPPDGTLDSWVLPDPATGFDAASLSDGTPVARQKLRQIVAVRLGFVLRTSLREKAMSLGRNYNAAAGTYTLDLFSDLQAAGQNVLRSRTVGGDDRYYPLPHRRGHRAAAQRHGGTGVMKAALVLSHRASAARQRGVVLLFSLIALVILLIASIALVRSFNTSLFTAGNLAFKRDLQNQGERAMDKVLTTFRSAGPLSSPTARAVNNTTYHYSATTLPTNALGIPTALQNATQYAAVADVSQDITAANDATLAAQAVSIQYVVDRLCVSGGDETVLGEGSCVLANNPVPSGTSSSNLQSADRAPLCPTCSSAAPQGVVYRLTVKVSGPRGTNSFFQSTFTIPSST